MSCYRPIDCYYKTGEPIKFTRPKKARPGEYRKIKVACGKCIGCRLDHAKTWVARLVMEYETNPTSYFLTLTYDDDHLNSMSLKKKDFQDFIKRLRKRFNFLDIKYFATGEYGDKTFRPHFHCILFGLEVMSDMFNPVKYDSSGHFYSKLLNEIWSNGYVVFAATTPENIGYTARYTLKKVDRDHKLSDFGLEDEKLLCSRGLGFNYFLEHFQSIIENDGFYYNGIKYNIPRYFMKKLEEYNSDIFKKIKEKREVISKIQNAIYSTKVLKILEQNKKDKIRSLTRSKV